MITRQVRIAVLGCGYWGINYVRLFSELPSACVAVVCDSRAERLQEVGRRFPGVALAGSVEQALQMDSVEAAVVCTEPSAHYDVARRCLEAGKHVLIEKPMTTTEADGRKLIDLASTKNVTLMVGHTFLYNPGIRKVKEYITQKKLHQIYYLYSQRTNLGPIRHDVNALWDLATHDISIFNYLIDANPAWVSAVGNNILQNAHEDIGFITVGYENGIIGHIHVSWAEPHKVREIVVVGNNMRIVFDDLDAREPVRVFEKGIALAPPETIGFGEYHFDISDGDIISPKIEMAEPLKNQCIHFLDCVTSGSRPLTSGSEGLAVVRAMTAIDRSVAQRGAPININQG